MRRSGAVVLGFLTLSVPGGSAAQRPAFGPLTHEEGGLLQRFSHTPMVEKADVLEPGSLAMDMWLGLSNVFEQDSTATHVLFIDMERLLTAATLRWGVAEDLELGGRVTFETTGGGVLDSFVHWYHDLLGFGQANRDRFPEGAYSQRLGDGGETTYLDVGPRTLGLEDVRVFAKWQLLTSTDGRSVLALRTEARFPAQSNRAGRRRSDASLAGLARLGVGSWYLHGMLSASTARATPELAPVLRNGSASLALAAERSLGASVAAVVQVQVSTPLLEGFDHRELDRPASNLVVGLAGRLGEDWSWDASFQEDLPADTPAIDFTLGLRVSRRWR